VALADDLRGEDRRGRRQRVHGRVDARAAMSRLSSVVPSKWVNDVNGAGSV
jgi:hypothetical protein